MSFEAEAIQLPLVSTVVCPEEDYGNASIKRPQKYFWINYQALRMKMVLLRFTIHLASVKV
jgi:hypothetical protein